MRSRRLLAVFDDDRLVREVAKGNPAAFEVIYDRHHRGLLSFCRHLLGSREEAEDALQQTFVSAYEHLVVADGKVRLKPWLYTIAHNRCMSMLRARRSEPSDEIEPSTDGLQHEVQQRADLRQLLGDLQRLPEDQRAALILSELKGLSHNDVSDILGCDSKKVKALVFQARSHLIEYRTAHDVSCTEIRREIAARRRGAPSRAVRSHVAVCSDCADFRNSIRSQRRSLALILPVIPAAGLRSHALAMAGASGGSAASGSAGTAWLAVHAQAVKLAAVGIAAVGATAVSAPLVVNHHHDTRVASSHALGAPRALLAVPAGTRFSPPASVPVHRRAATGHHHAVRDHHAVTHESHRHHAGTRHTAHARVHKSTSRGVRHAYAYGHRTAPGFLRRHRHHPARPSRRRTRGRNVH